MYFQGLEKAVHVWVSWKVCILLPNLVRLAHSMKKKADEGHPSLTSKTVHTGTIKGKIVRPIFTVKLGLQEACNWISVPLEAQLTFSLPCSALAVPGGVKRQQAMLHVARMISIHQIGSWSSTATCRLQPDDGRKKQIEGRSEMPCVAVPPLHGLHYRSLPQHFQDLYKVWEIFLFVYILQWIKNTFSILIHLTLDL